MSILDDKAHLDDLFQKITHECLGDQIILKASGIQSLDYPQVSVTRLRRALELAYKYGRVEAFDELRSKGAISDV